MKKLYSLFIFLLITVIISNCTKDFDEINKNPKALEVANLNQASYGLIVRRAIYISSYLRNSIRFQNMWSTHCDMFAQYMAGTAANFLYDRMMILDKATTQVFNNFYRDAAVPIVYSIDFAKEYGLAVEEAMMKIFKVFVFQRYTDLFGPLPYSEFGNLQKTVPYDSQEAIYNSFFDELDEAITVLKANTGKTSATLSNYDAIYAGKVDKWLKFGNSVRLRVAMRLKYVQPQLAKSEAEKAVADGVLTDNSDNGWVKTTVDWFNPYTQITSWGEFRMSADMESILKGYLDPRVKSYYQPALKPDATDDPVGIVFNYEGLRNGQSKSDMQVYKFIELASQMAVPYTLTNTAGPNFPVMRAAESYFLRAEGALEGWAMGGSAANLYKAGIEASLTENGYADLKNLAGEVYSTSPLVPASPLPGLAPVSTVPVAFETAGTKERQLEQIITQKWIALWPDSPEAYSERRRTKYPKLYPRLYSDNTDIPVTSIPTRQTYPISEYDNNRAAVDAAIVMLGGPDNGATKVWWDKK